MSKKLPLAIWRLALVLTIVVGLAKQLKTAFFSIKEMKAFYVLTDISGLTAYLLPGVIGFLVLKKFLNKTPLPPALLLSLAPGLGMIFTAFLLFATLSLWNQLPQGFILTLHGALLVFLLLISRNPAKPSKNLRPRGNLFLWQLIFLSAAVLFFAKVLKSPEGSGMDVWAIWKLKASLIYHNSSEWKQIFSKAMDASHPDYPLFYPLLLCWGWIFTGKENISAPIWLSFVTTLAAVGVLASALWNTNKRAAYASALVLISTPHFIGMGSSLYADIFVAYFMLASVVLLKTAFDSAQWRLAFLSGLFAGAGSFIKNEGLLVLLLSFLVLGYRMIRRGETRACCISFLAASLPLVGCTIFFKVTAAYPNPHISMGSCREVLVSGLIFARGFEVIRAGFQEFLNVNSWSFAWVFFLFFMLINFGSFRKKEFGWISALILGTGAGYFLIYLGTPMELKDLLQNSLSRLLIHVYPVIGYLVFSLYSDIYLNNDD